MPKEGMQTLLPPPSQHYPPPNPETSGIWVPYRGCRLGPGVVASVVTLGCVCTGEDVEDPRVFLLSSGTESVIGIKDGNTGQSS